MLAGSVLLYRVEVCRGMWEESWANRQGADEGGEDFCDGEAAPTGLLAV